MADTDFDFTSKLPKKKIPRKSPKKDTGKVPVSVIQIKALLNLTGECHHIYIYKYICISKILYIDILIYIHIFESRNIDGEKKSVGGGQWKQLLNQVHCTQIPRITVDLRRNASVWYYGELVLTKPPTTHGKTRELQLNLKAPLHT